MMKEYHKTPSELLNIVDDEYTSYCLNEACYYIDKMIENGNEPTFEKRYKSFTDLYNDYL